MQKLDKLVTLDFDGTLFDGSNLNDELAPIIGIVELAKRLTKICSVAILTTRRNIHMPQVKEFVAKHFAGYDVAIYNTNFSWKAEWLANNPLPNHLAHLDDNPTELERWNLPNVELFMVHDYQKLENRVLAEANNE